MNHNDKSGWIPSEQQEFTDLKLPFVDPTDGEVEHWYTVPDEVQGWIINKFITGEYKNFPQLLEKFGNINMANVAITHDRMGNDVVYINGYLIMCDGGNGAFFNFVMPFDWESELSDIINTYSAVCMKNKPMNDDECAIVSRCCIMTEIRMVD